LSSIGSVGEREIEHNVLLGGGVKEGKYVCAIQDDGGAVLDPVRDVNAANLVDVR